MFEDEARGDATAWIDAAKRLVRQLAAQPLTSAVDDDALTNSVAALQQLTTMAEAEKLRRIAALDTRAAHLGRARSTADLVATRCNLSSREALQQTRLAEDLTELPTTAARLAEGTIGLSHAREASRSLSQLRTAVADGALPVAQLDSGAAAIDGHTAGLAAPGGTTRSAARLRRDLAELTTTSDSLAARERVAFANRRLWIGPADGADDDMIRIDGLLDPLTGTKLMTALAPLANRSGPDDPRNLPQRTCDALAALCDTTQRQPSCAPGRREPGPTRHTFTAGDHAGATATPAPLDGPAALPARPSVLLLTTSDALAGAPDATPSRLDGYGPVSAATAQQLACDAEVTVVTRDRNGAVLDVGRTRRLPTARQRRAVTARDQGCIGCTAPALRCQIHHIRAWHTGGPTDLANLVLLCPSCHTNVHHFGWTISRTPDGAYTAGPPPPDGGARPDSTTATPQSQDTG